jgi:hypothetical protein
MSPESRLRIKVLIQDEEDIGADVTLNCILVERASDMISVNFCSLLKCEVELSLTEADLRNLIHQLSCFTQTH